MTGMVEAWVVKACGAFLRTETERASTFWVAFWVGGGGPTDRELPTGGRGITGDGGFDFGYHGSP